MDAETKIMRDDGVCAATTTTTTLQRPKPNLPSFEEIRRAVPSSCFEKSLIKSLFYLVFDSIILYGMFGSSLFVVGHDCGHGTFSEYTWVNDFFGHIAHASLLVPYWPWQKSHRLHHQYTSHIDNDMGHPWVVEKDFMTRGWIIRNFSKIPLSGFIRWSPIYTIVGLPDGSHFWPYSKLFNNNRERVKCVVSGLACVFCAVVAFVLCSCSWYTFIKYYYVSLLFQGYWLVIITYLQHNDYSIEFMEHILHIFHDIFDCLMNESLTTLDTLLHYGVMLSGVYEEDYWSYVMGQVQTIDRVYGFGIDTLLHHITDGHVAHHFFFTKIPHYHLMEATAAIRNVLEPYKAYRCKSNSNFYWII
ncbi:Delta(12) fatty acid desaturase fat-2 [Dirofilaria immitis]|nr:Delta(12) fatty acid desaturase fat-2 [Dirofilaria immitis]